MFVACFGNILISGENGQENDRYSPLLANKLFGSEVDSPQNTVVPQYRPGKCTGSIPVIFFGDKIPVNFPSVG